MRSRNSYLAYSERGGHMSAWPMPDGALVVHTLGMRIGPSMGSSSSKSKKIKRQTDLLPLDHDSTTVHVTVGEDDEGEKTDEETPVIHGLSEEQLKLLQGCLNDLGMCPVNDQTMDTVTAAVLSHIKVELYEAGVDLIVKGQAGEKLYVVEAGSLDVLSEEGSEVLASLVRGSYFGEVSLLYGVPCTANVRTVTQCRLLCLDREVVNQEFEPVNVDIIDWFVSHSYIPTSPVVDAKRTQRRTLLWSLKSIHLFADWSIDVLKSFILEMEPALVTVYPKHSAILLQGDHIDSLWIVLRGSILTRSSAETLAMVDTSLKKMPFVIGEEGLFLDKISTLDIYCSSCCQVIQINKYCIDTLIEQFPESVGKSWGECMVSWTKLSESRVILQKTHPTLLQTEVLFQLLYQNPLLRQCSYSFVQSLGIQATPYEYKPGATVYDRKKYSKDKGSMAVVVKGSLKLLTITGNHTVRKVEQGDIFYKCSWMSDKAMVVAGNHGDKDTLLWQIPSQAVLESLERFKDSHLSPPPQPLSQTTEK
ncbi:hypothetical protein ScPMuIL_012593 [Solemya velum]